MYRFLHRTPCYLRRIALLPLCFISSLYTSAAAQPAPALDSAAIAPKYKVIADRLIAAAQRDSSAYNRLAELCDTFGPRLSGTRSLEQAIDWVLAKMKSDSLDDVHGEDVMVPYWKRGNESCTLLKPRVKSLPMMSLGGSVATPRRGITAEVLVVEDFEDLQLKAAEAKGKIVLFNVPFKSYGETVRVRVLGAQRAAAVGAVASLIRSVGPFSMMTPHTGGMLYADSIPKIPHAAISLEDAEMIARMSRRGEKIRVQLKLEAKMMPDAPSRNIVAEIQGSSAPEEVVVFGGHIDSWDVGQGAMDDGGGCIAAWHALKIIKQLGLRPRRTLRVVLWTNEENGLRGATAYAEKHAQDKHFLAIESDEGVFKPQGFSYGGRPELLPVIRAIAGLLAPIGAEKIRPGGGGADIGPLMQKGVPGMSLQVDGSRYFWYHHTNADTMDKLDAADINRCAAALAVMAYIAADLP